jgi:hypothetical protein
LLIFVFILSDLSNGQVKNGDFDNSRMAKRKSLDLSKRQPNYIEISYIDRVILILGVEREITSFKVGYKLKRWFTVLG